MSAAEQSPETDALALGVKCAGCGHAASLHPSAVRSASYLAATNGRYEPSCSGREGNVVNQFGPIACRCTATCERVACSTDRITPPAHGCAKTCLTAPSSVTGRCDHCKEQA